MNNSSKSHSKNEVEIEHSWQTAGERMFLYLRCLKFPVDQIFEIAAGVLKEARQNVMSRPNPVAYCMAAVRDFVRNKAISQNSFSCDGDASESIKKIPGHDSDSSSDNHELASMPVICRLHMTPEDFSSITFFAGFSRNNKQDSKK